MTVIRLTGIQLKENSKIIADHNETIEHRARRKAQNKGKGVTEVEKQSIVKYYLEGSNVSDIAKALMTINAVKGVEIGNGFDSVNEDGKTNVDEMILKNGKPTFLSNNNGGFLGGISSGQNIVCRFVVKPTSSIISERKTIDVNLQETTISTKGRHDPCVGIRAVPVGEAMLATTIADHCLRYF